MLFIILLRLLLVSQADLFCLDIGRINSLFLQYHFSNYIIPVFCLENCGQLSILVFLSLFCFRISKKDTGVFFVDPVFPTHDPANKAFAWEAYYDYKVNDGITITPAIFKYNNRSTGSTGQNDGFGGLIQTTFKF